MSNERTSLLPALPCGHPKSEETSADGYTFCAVCAVQPRPSHAIERTWHDGGSVVGAVCRCGREGTLSEIQEHSLLVEQEGDECV
jgi:hypothetical protein